MTTERSTAAGWTDCSVQKDMWVQKDLDVLAPNYPISRQPMGLKRPLGKKLFQENVRGGRGGRKISCRRWEKMTAVWSWIPGRGRAAADVHLSSQLSSLSENTAPVPFPQHTQVCFFNRHSVHVMSAYTIWTEWEKAASVCTLRGKKRQSEEAGSEDGMSDCRCIMCSAAVKSSTRRGKVVAMETSIVWKLMQWGVSALVRTDPAQPKGTAAGEERAKNEKLLQWVLTAPPLLRQVTLSWLCNDNGGQAVGTS